MFELNEVELEMVLSFLDPQADESHEHYNEPKAILVKRMQEWLDSIGIEENGND
jgi:hypothetical protein